jgi:hypothetical protein
MIASVCSFPPPALRQAADARAHRGQRLLQTLRIAGAVRASRRSFRRARQFAVEAADEGVAGRVLRGEIPRQALDLLADRVEPVPRLRAASSPACWSAARFCSIAANKAEPCASMLERVASIASARGHRAVHGGVHAGRRFLQPRGRRRGGAFDARRGAKPSRWAAPPATSSASRPRAISADNWPSSAPA